MLRKNISYLNINKVRSKKTYLKLLHHHKTSYNFQTQPCIKHKDIPNLVSYRFPFKDQLSLDLRSY